MQLFNQNWLIVPRQQFQDQLSDLVLISWLWVDDANGFGQLYLPIAKKMYTGLVFLKLIKQTGGKTSSVLIVHSFFGFPFVMVQPNWQFSERWKMSEKGAKKEQEKKSLFSHVLTQQLLGYHIWRNVLLRFLHPLLYLLLYLTFNIIHFLLKSYTNTYFQFVSSQKHLWTLAFWLSMDWNSLQL